MGVAGLKQWARALKRDVVALWIAGRDRRVPWHAKAVAAAVAAYALSPIDLIPDFIPVLGYLDDLILVPLGIVGFLSFSVLVIVGTSNAVNLTDGLDGLAIGPVIMAAGVFALINYIVGNAIYTNYLYVHHVPRAGELSVLLAALVGAGLGFLWFNAPPAMVFMGDTGSLSIGGALGGVALGLPALSRAASSRSASERTGARRPRSWTGSPTTPEATEPSAQAPPAPSRSPRRRLDLLGHHLDRPRRALGHA